MILTTYLTMLDSNGHKVDSYSYDHPIKPGVSEELSETLAVFYAGHPKGSVEVTHTNTPREPWPDSIVPRKELF